MIILLGFLFSQTLMFFRERKQYHTIQTLRKTQTITNRRGGNTTIFNEATTTETFSFLAPQPLTQPRFCGLEEEDYEEISGDYS